MAPMDRTDAKPVTPFVLGAFCIFATAMSALASTTLLAPGGPLDAIWRVKPGGYAQLRALGPWVGWGFAALGFAALATCYGVFRRRRWGWWAAVIGISGNGLGDLARGITGAWLDGLVGVTVAGAILWWLTRLRVRALFDR